MSASMKWRHSGHLQLLSRAKHPFTAMAEIEVSPQDEMANPPQRMKRFAVERHAGTAKTFILCVVCNRYRSYLPRIMRLGVVHSRVRHLEGLCVSCLRSTELSAEERQKNSCISCTHAQMGACSTFNGRNCCVCIEHVEDGGRGCLWSGCERKSVFATQVHSTHATRSP